MTKHAYPEIMSAVREQEPLVQCLTNSVVMDITANVLLAIGASPAMCDTPTESAEFAAVASGVLVNAGTPSYEQYAGMRAAVAGATAAGTPWVLDPVACGGLTERTRFQRSIALEKPSAIRGNASEIIALAHLDENAAGGRGVDSADTADAAIPAARALAERTGGVVGISGATDIVVSEGRITRITGGDPLMQKVIGTGCSLGAVVAAYLSVGADPHDAVVAAHAHHSAAGAKAAKTASAPGSFKVAWLDTLYTLTSDELEQYASCEEESL